MASRESTGILKAARNNYITQIYKPAVNTGQNLTQLNADRADCCDTY
jgi:hypothetical protein